MSRSLLWLTMAVFGSAAVLMSSVVSLFGSALFLLLTLPLIVRGDHLVALSGLLIGIGATWTVAMARQAATGAVLDNATGWWLVGWVPLAAGVALLMFAIVAERAGRRADHRRR